MSWTPLVRPMAGYHGTPTSRPWRSHCMTGYALRLTRDDLPAGAAPRALPVLNRVLYVLAGDLTVTTGGNETPVAEHSAVFVGGAATATVGPRGATVLRYEVVRDGAEPDGAGTLLLEHALQLAAGEPYLMRCDRVDFDPGGVALAHRHKGGGIQIGRAH